MTMLTVTCSRPDRHSDYLQPDGSCWLCVEVASWPVPDDTQAAVFRRVLPPLTPEEAEATRYASTSARRTA